MIRFVKKYQDMSEQERMLFNSSFAVRVSALLITVKFIVGLFYDVFLLGISAYSAALLLAKFTCITEIKKGSVIGKSKNRVFLFLFFASVLYLLFTWAIFLTGRKTSDNNIANVSLTAFIAFAELILALTGLAGNKVRGNCFLMIKVINLCAAFIAIMTTQIVILDFTGTYGTELPNALTGTAVGVFITLCSLYIVVLPYVSIYGKEHNVFKASNGKCEKSVSDMERFTEILLVRSTVYGSMVYRATVSEDSVSGDIVREKSLWRRMPLLWKIVCCILSEILLFVWLVGRAVYFFRTLNVVGKLQKLMENNGFERTEQ